MSHSQKKPQSHTALPIKRIVAPEAAVSLDTKEKRSFWICNRDAFYPHARKNATETKDDTKAKNDTKAKPDRSEYFHDQ
ncbi:hypothetical protein BGX33_003832 [Mortierella sp. NVP41]|nr:hypothetical protein BGX33_003832 [Mortierella sp. NVP41]